MRRFLAAALAAFFAALVCHAVPAQSAEGVTWRREHVRNLEIAAMERALGAAAVAHLRVEPKIVGGIKAVTGRWPFQVALLDASVANNHDAQFCGGALVHRLYVVTAAHCVYGSRPAEIHVLTGTQSLTSGGTRRAVAAIRVHPSFNNRTLDYDIAVVRLKTAATGIAVSTLMAATEERRLASDGTPAFVTGWGNTNAAGSSYPTDLRQVRVPLVATRDCNDANSYDGAITGRMICAGYTAGGKDACAGDSGGPLVLRNRQGVWALQAGIVSWGIGCAERNLFGVYSRVAVLSAWANRIVTGLSPAQTSSECEVMKGDARMSCIDNAIAANDREMLSYLDVLRSTANPAMKTAAETGHSAWSASLEGLCAFDRAARGESGRKLCVLKEMEKRAATLAEKLSTE